MTNLAIKGHPTRGSEVIFILKMLGGEVKKSYVAPLVGAWIETMRTLRI